MGYLEPQSQYQRLLCLLSHLFNKLYKQWGEKVTLMLWFCLLSWLRCPLMLNFHKARYNLNIFLYLLKLLRRLNRHALHGTTSPYITGLIQGLAQSEWLIPYDSEMIARTYPLWNFYNSRHGGKMKPLNRLKEIQLLILLLILLWNN